MIETVAFSLGIVLFVIMIRGSLIKNEILKIERNKLRSPLDKRKLKYERTKK